MNPRTISLLSAARNLIVLTILLTSCQSAPSQARRIMAPVAKKAEQAGKLVEKQSGSIGRLKVSTREALRIAEKMHATRPDGDTAALILAERMSEKEVIALTGTNEELCPTIDGLKIEAAKAQDKISVEIAGAETWRAWAWRWWWAFSATVAAIGALVYFRHSIPLLRFL